MLPMGQDRPDGTSFLPSSEGGDHRQENPAERIRIVVVEDEAIAAMDLEMLLEELGYEVCDVVMSAPEAIRTAERSKPDLLLMDIRLADNTDGVTAALEIRARFGIRSVFLTAHTDAATMARVRAANPFAV